VTPKKTEESGSKQLTDGEMLTEIRKQLLTLGEDIQICLFANQHLKNRYHKLASMLEMYLNHKKEG